MTVSISLSWCLVLISIPIVHQSVDMSQNTKHHICKHTVWSVCAGVCAIVRVCACACTRVCVCVCVLVCLFSPLALTRKDELFLSLFPSESTKANSSSSEGRGEGEVKMGRDGCSHNVTCGRCSPPLSANTTACFHVQATLCGDPFREVVTTMNDYHSGGSQRQSH